MKTHKFRPHGYGKSNIILSRKLGIKLSEANWPERRVWCSDTRPNKIHISKVFMNLHYLASHSPEPIKCKWRVVERRFYLKYFGAPGRSSVRFANTWTCHSWL